MMGHTDRETINKRKPLSQGMRDMIADLARNPIRWGELSTAGKNRARALVDRGYLHWIARDQLAATDEGKAAIE